MLMTLYAGERYVKIDKTITIPSEMLEQTVKFFNIRSYNHEANHVGK